MIRSIVMMLCAACAAAGQDELPPPPDQQPPPDESVDPSVHDVAREMIGRTKPAGAISPHVREAPRPILPGQEGLEASAQAKAPEVLLPENAFVSRRPGRLLRLQTGDWVFVFAPGPDGAAIGPMLVIPCSALERAEATIESPDAGALFEISGRVYLYHGRNYILPNARFGFLPASVESPEQIQRTDTRVANVLEPGMAAIIESLEEEREGHRPISSLDPVASELSREEESFVVRRRGRLRRLDAGQWAFIVDADTQANPALDPVRVLTPSQALMKLEVLAAQHGQDLVVELTGRTLTYKMRRYIIPMMFDLARDEQITPLQ